MATGQPSSAIHLQPLIFAFGSRRLSGTQIVELVITLLKNDDIFTGVTNFYAHQTQNGQSPKTNAHVHKYISVQIIS